MKQLDLLKLNVGAGAALTLVLEAMIFINLSSWDYYNKVHAIMNLTFLFSMGTIALVLWNIFEFTRSNAK